MINEIDTSSIKGFPEHFSGELPIHKLTFTEKVRLGLLESEGGVVYTKEEARKRLSKWLK